MSAVANTDDGLSAAVVAVLDRAVTKLHQSSTLRELYTEFGITPPPDVAPPRLTPADADVLRSSITQLNAAQTSRRLDHRQLRGVLNIYRSEPLTTLAARPPIGRPGTAMIDGVPQVEHNFNLIPSEVHGTGGWPGIYEELYRTDSGIYKHCNDHGTLFESTVYEPVLPESERDNDRLAEVVRRTNAAIMRAERRDNVRGNVSTLIRHGHAIVETCWERLDGFWQPWKLMYIEQSALRRLVFDDRGIDLVGAQFEVYNTDMPGQRDWTLTRGETPDTAQLLIFNYNAVGNNWLGVPPTRPATGLRKLKELILEIQGIGFQRFGVPIIMILHELAGNIVAEAGRLDNPNHKAELQKLANRLETKRARHGAVVAAPVGIRAEVLSPQGEMPDARSFLEYLDYCIALCFSNEGAMLGTGSGSYALAGMKENAFLRSAPAYTRSYVRGLNDLMRLSVQFNYGGWEKLDEMPYYTSRLPGSQDASRWTADMAVLWNNKVWLWPEPARRMAASNMGLPADAFDDPEMVATMVNQAANQGVTA